MKQKFPSIIEYNGGKHNDFTTEELCNEFFDLRGEKPIACEVTTNRIMSPLRVARREKSQPSCTELVFRGEIQCPALPADTRAQEEQTSHTGVEGFPIELQYCEFVMDWFDKYERIPTESYWPKLCSGFMRENGLEGDLPMRCKDVSRNIFNAIRQDIRDCDEVPALDSAGPTAPQHGKHHRRFSLKDEASLPIGGKGKCELCHFIRDIYYDNDWLEGPEPSEYEAECKGLHRRRDVSDEGVLSYCEEVMAETFTAVRSGKPFRCTDIVREQCPQDKTWSESPFLTDVNFYKPSKPNKAQQVRVGSKVESLVQELNELVGLASVKAGLSSVRDAVEFDMWRKKFLGEEATLLGQSFHMRFDGNPGTGKTVVARIAGKILVDLGVVRKPKSENDDTSDTKSDGASDFVFKEVSKADLVGGYVGSTAPKVRKAVESAFGGVLFIDEAYSLVQNDRDVFGKEAVDTLIKEMEDHRDKLIVIFAGYRQEMDTFFESNPGFQSRVPFRFEFPDYSCEEPGEIARYGLRKQDVVACNASHDWIKKIISTKTGCCTQEALDKGTCAAAGRDNGNGRTVRNILESSLRAMAVRAVSTQKGAENRTKLVTELTPIDVAAVGGEVIKEDLRSTCKVAGKTLKDLESLTTGARILAASDFEETLALARSSCDHTRDFLEGINVNNSLASSAADVEIENQTLREIFAELDEMVGLISVKKAMREFYCTVEFARLRREVGLKALNGQSFHMRFLGNPGTGKTVVARIVGKLLVALGAIKDPPPEQKESDEDRDEDEDDHSGGEKHAFQRPPETWQAQSTRRCSLDIVLSLCYYFLFAR
ncbi:spoVK [Symbiodinium pilosum]|uniref:SpoVK protein n=1 Tax=Symbiodinium pilosum TaxID=2952 RepID=A0A812M485_SYMPI|nr:spoVK [Symbiodinium pilosum]